jgi:hypothetical protein
MCMLIYTNTSIYFLITPCIGSNRTFFVHRFKEIIPERPRGTHLLLPDWQKRAQISGGSSKNFSLTRQVIEHWLTFFRENYTENLRDKRELRLVHGEDGSLFFVRSEVRSLTVPCPQRQLCMWEHFLWEVGRGATFSGNAKSLQRIKLQQMTLYLL